MIDCMLADKIVLSIAQTATESPPSLILWPLLFHQLSTNYSKHQFQLCIGQENKSGLDSGVLKYVDFFRTNQSSDLDA